MTLRADRIVPVLALLLGAGYALTFLDFDFIAGRGPYWSQAYGDRITNLIGVVYFIRDEWRFPLFYVPQLAFPEGANIVYTDSLPLLALALKLAYKVSGEWFNYFGLWLFLCFPLLAVFTALAVREALPQRVLPPLAAAVIAVCSPALLTRFGHSALMGHFLIAWSLWLYLRLHRVPDNWNAVAQLCFVSSVAVLLQAYFVLMVVPVGLAAFAQAAVERRLSLARAAAGGAAVISAVLAAAFVAGIIGPGSGQASAWGFGYFSMNLLSPFIPPREHVPEFVARAIKWDGNGYSVDATGGQYEGYNYLGAGVLLLGAVHVATSGRLLATELKRHAFLVAVLLGFMLLAISSHIFMGERLIAEFRMPALVGELTDRFRTSGRMFWPIYYVLAVGLVVLTARRFSPLLAGGLLVIAVALQVADTQLLRRNIAIAASRGFDRSLPSDAWRAVLRSHQSFYQYPSFQCGGWAGQWPENNSNLELLWLVAELGTRTNSAYLARLSRDCEAELRQALKFDIEAGGLYVFAGRFPIARLEGRPNFAAWCREFEHGIVCSRDWVSEPAVVQTFRPIERRWLQPYKLSGVLSFSAGGDGVEFLGDGWWQAEPWGTWSKGNGELTLRLSSPPATDLLLSVDGHAFVEPVKSDSQVTVIANEKEVAVWHFGQGEGIKTVSARIPLAALQQDGLLRLRFVSKDMTSPHRAGVSPDQRELGFGLKSLTLAELPTSGN
jgi:hypothetical protein